MLNYPLYTSDLAQIASIESNQKIITRMEWKSVLPFHEITLNDVTVFMFIKTHFHFDSENFSNYPRTTSCLLVSNQCRGSAWKITKLYDKLFYFRTYF